MPKRLQELFDHVDSDVDFLGSFGDGSLTKVATAVRSDRGQSIFGSIATCDTKTCRARCRDLVRGVETSRDESIR